MSPIDEAEAFVRMAADGAELADIAAKAGVSEATVKRRLALAALCDEAKEAVRSGSISLSVAEALTLGTADQQRESLARLKRYHHADADDVRGWLVDDKPPVSAAIFPIEQYKGTLTRDLFGSEEETFFDDVEQFQTLQAAAVARQVQMHRDSGAAFVEVITDYQAAWWHYREAKDGETPGVVIHHAPSGHVEARAGLVRIPVKASVNETKPRPEYSEGLLQLMASHKTVAVQSVLLSDIRMAKIVAVVQMMNGFNIYCSRIHLKTHWAHLVFAKANAKPAALAKVEDSLVSLSSCLDFEISDDDKEPLAVRLTTHHKNAIALYESVKRLPDDHLDRLLAALTAACFGQTFNELDTKPDSLFNRVARDLNVNMADCWRPDEVFLSRRTLEQLKDIARDSGALPHLGTLKEYKKKSLVAALARYFQRTDIEAAKTWLPDAMLFPAIGESAAETEQAAAEDNEADDMDEAEELEDAA